MDQSQVWNGQDSTLSGQDDFQQFLDMNLGENLQFDFQDFQTQQDAQMLQGGNVDAMDTSMGNVQQIIAHDTSMQEAMAAITATANFPNKVAHAHPVENSIVELDAQIQYLQQQRQQQQQRQIQDQQRNFYAQQRMIPPTPNSVEMHGANFPAYGQAGSQQQMMFDGYQMPRKEDMAFTPLVSPAVTPLETHFNIPEYTIPGAYFSPLSSPALHAQNEHSAAYTQHLSNTTNSPIDMNVDSHSAPTSSSLLAKKPTRKAPASKTRNSRSVRQSPIVKPKRGKRNSVTTIPNQILSDILEPNGVAIDTGMGSSAPSTAESESDSITPEHLSEMAPPPLPGSANRSPFVQAHKDPIQQRLALGSPATPASLMRSKPSPHSASQMSQNMDIDEAMDAFVLPEPATDSMSRPQLSRIETTSDGQTTPTLNSVNGKSPFLVMPSPSVLKGRNSTTASPRIDATNSITERRTPSLAPRGPKKRSSTSVSASPALLPRISPSIKPMLPGSSKNIDDTASLLLASKSNYQNILEGTHLPGVSYPTELSTNLTSKRTSHKIAEQGRRNRINSALQEIATLLPKGGAKDSGTERTDGAEDGEKEGGKKGSTQSANSKASTVEQAIEYIKQLQKEVSDANKRAEEAEKELAKTKA